MRCAWDAYVNLLPLWMREYVDKQGRGELLELRLRTGLPPELVTLHGSTWMQRVVSNEDLRFCVNAASKYSPWSAATSCAGYITAPGGHRIGLCGRATVSNGNITGFSDISSVCIRVARDYPGIAERLKEIVGPILILGKPGSGKTTLLRDLIRQKSYIGSGSICVVDEKGEVFPKVGNSFCFETGQRTDVLTGAGKRWGLDVLIRNMSPSFLAVDEVTAEEDCHALLHAAWCGVTLYATAHAASVIDFMTRPIYAPLLKYRLFEEVVVLQQDKSWRLERINI